MCLGITFYGQISGVSFESPSNIGKRKVQLSGSYRMVGCIDRYGQNLYINQAGIKAGVGITDYIDIMASYWQWSFKENQKKSHVFGLITKVGFGHQHVAFYLPVLYYNDNGDYEPGYHGTQPVFLICPKVITSVFRTRIFELTVSPYMEIIKEKNYIPEYTTGLSIGIGLGSGSGRWSFITESGLDLLSLFVGCPVFSLGASLNIHIGKLEKERIIGY